jgi:medium-chain acyl-[acyl-carrier-protein] hydrolase
MAWAREAPADVDLCAVQLPGRENRLGERAYTRIEPLIDAAFEALQPYLEPPFALFGHSMGALLAFEFARRVRRAGGPMPVRLLVSGHRGPDLPRRYPPMSDLADVDFVAELRRRYAGVPEAIFQQPDLLALFLPCLRADMSVVEHYRCDDEPPLDCPIAAYGGVDDPEAAEPELFAWRRQTGASFTLRRFAGAHFYLRDGRRELLAAIGRDLAGAGEQVVGTALPR